MKTLLKFSLLVNLLLLGAGILFWMEVRQPSTTAKSSVRPVIQPEVTPVAAAVAVPTSTPVTVPAVGMAAFRWSQLDAADYPAYVKNLRAVGCPEPTLRAIVTADVQAAFSVYAQKLTETLASRAGASWATRLATALSDQALRDELQRLPEAAAAKIDDLLGIIHPAPAELAGAGGEDAASEPMTVTMPLAFRNVDPATLNLNEDQMQALADLRQQFVEQIGTTNRPDDPAYLARWQQSQPQADVTLRAMLGNRVFDKLQTAPDSVKTGGN